MGDCCVDRTSLLNCLDNRSSLRTSGYETISRLAGTDLEWAVAPGIVIVYYYIIIWESDCYKANIQVGVDYLRKYLLVGCGGHWKALFNFLLNHRVS